MEIIFSHHVAAVSLDVLGNLGNAVILPVAQEEMPMVWPAVLGKDSDLQFLKLVANEYADKLLDFAIDEDVLPVGRCNLQVQITFSHSR